MSGAASLEGLRLLVSGATGGVGTALVRHFVDRGALVAGIDRNEPDAATRALFGDRVLWLKADLSKQEIVRDACDLIAQWSDRLDIVVHAAGSYEEDPPPEDTGKVLWRLWADNVQTAACLSFSFFPLLCRGRKPLLVHIASADAVVASGGQSCEIGVRHDVLYATTKGALLTLTRALAMKWAGTGVRVNAICPTVIRTPMSASLLQVPGKEDELVAHLPLGRICEPDEIAVAVECLYRLEMTTAHILPLDAGYLCL